MEFSDLSFQAETGRDGGLSSGGFNVANTEPTPVNPPVRGALRLEEELRRVIAREIHDDLGQKCALLTMKMGALHQEVSSASSQLASRVEELQRLSKLLSDGLQQVSHQLHPAVLEHCGLEKALRSLVLDFGKQQAVSVLFSVGQMPRFISPEISLCVYRIAQEALRNISKHAGETQIRVSLRMRAQRLTLIIRDFGPGFDPRAMRTDSGLGLISMKERATLAGGVCHIVSRRQAGTLIKVSIPQAATCPSPEFSQPKRNQSPKSRCRLQSSAS